MLSVIVLFGLSLCSANKFRHGRFGGSAVDIQVTNCSKSTDEAKITGIDYPSSSKTDANFTIVVNALAEVGITEGTFEAVAKLGPIPVFKQSGDFCKADTIVLPGNAGTIYYQGVGCPLDSSKPFVLQMTAAVSSSAPDDTVKVSITSTDSKTKTDVMCFDVVVSVKG